MSRQEALQNLAATAAASAQTLEGVSPPNNGCLENKFGNSCIWAGSIANFLNRLAAAARTGSPVSWSGVDSFRLGNKCKKCLCHRSIDTANTTIKTAIHNLPKE